MVRLRREDRPAVPPAREGDRPRRASSAQAGSARDDLPGLDRRAQLLAGRVRPQDGIRLQRGGGDGGRPDPGSAQPDAEEAQAPARRRLPRASERQLRRRTRRVEGPRLDQRDQRVDRPPRLEVQHAGAGARRRDGDRQRARLRGWRRRCPARLRPHEREGPLDVPDRPTDRSRADDLHRRREGVHRDHRRRHADVLGRRPRLAAAGVRDRREQDRVAEAALDVVLRARSRRRPRRTATTAAAPTRSVAAATTARAQGADPDRRRSRLADVLDAVHVEPGQRRRPGCLRRLARRRSAGRARPLRPAARDRQRRPLRLARRLDARPAPSRDRRRRLPREGRRTGTHRRASSARFGAPRAGSASRTGSAVSP